MRMQVRKWTLEGLKMDKGVRKWTREGLREECVENAGQKRDYRGDKRRKR